MNHFPYNEHSNSLGLIHQLSLVDSVNPCSIDTSKTIRSTIYAFQKVVAGLQILVGTMKDAKDFGCDAVPGAPIPLVGFSDIGKVVCTAAVGSYKIAFQIILDIADIALDVAVRIYDEVCKDLYQPLLHGAIYDNVILNAKNIITTFAATQQLKVMLGDVQAGLEDDREERKGDGRRLQEENCKDFDITRGFLPAPCNQTACQDLTRLCDGSYNYLYISELITG